MCVKIYINVQPNLRINLVCVLHVCVSVRGGSFWDTLRDKKVKGAHRSEEHMLRNLPQEEDLINVVLCW